MESKRSVRDLAVFGGEPTFQRDLYVGRPNIPDADRFLDRARGILDSASLTNNGKYVRLFEERLTEWMGVRHCVPIVNGTVALDLAIRALGMSGEVILPSFTFIATAHALQWLGITPVFCDVDPVTHNLDPSRVEELITPRTTGILGVHLWGRCCDVSSLSGIAQEHGLRLMFDAAHALGCSHRGEMVGNLGDAEVFSFHATKFLNTFEGGAVATNDDDIGAKVRSMRNFGFAGFDRVELLGTNGKMNEMCAAMGVTGLENLDSIIAHNRSNHELYAIELAGLPDIKLVAYDGDERNNYQYVVLEVSPSGPITRDALVKVLHAERVVARRYFYPGCHGMEPYRTLYPEVAERLPVTCRLASSVLALPTGTAVNGDDIRRVCSIIQFAFANGPEISGLLTDAEAV